MRRLVLLAVIVLASALPACAGGEPAHGSGGDRILVTIRTGHGVVELADLEVARTSGARARGLMGRTSLPEDGGMAFLFDGPTTDAFWMKDTLIQLSILFWDQHGRIVDILDMLPCRAEPCPLYRASGPYVGAIEMNRGAFDRLGVKVGDTLGYRLLGA